MLESVGHPVIKLIRIRFGPLQLGDLPIGQYRYLTDREANALRGLLKERSRFDPSTKLRAGVRGATVDSEAPSGTARPQSVRRSTLRPSSGQVF